MSHNKTLAAQLYSEFKNFFPHNAVEYFVILLRLLPARSLHPAQRHLHREGLLDQRRDRATPARAMGSLLTRKDAIVVASVSCIYGLGSPEDYENMMVPDLGGPATRPRGHSSARWSPCCSNATTSPSAAANSGSRGDVVEVHPAYLDDDRDPGRVLRRRDRPRSAASTR